MAQMAAWIAGLLPVLALGYVFMEIALGHPQQRSSIQVSAIQATMAGVWLTLYGIAGYLIGERKVAGGVLGLALFGGTLALAAVRDGVLTLGVAYSLVGIVLIVRAGRALRLPLLSSR